MSAGPDLDRAADVVGYVVASLVDQPDMVRVTAHAGVMPPRLDIEVGPGDMGRVIGKRGRVANAIRAVGRAAASTDGDDTVIDVEFVD